jgi:hypothetical protein
MPQTSPVFSNTALSEIAGHCTAPAAGTHSDRYAASGNAEFSTPSTRAAAPFSLGPLQRAVDSDPRSLNATQITTLQAIFSRFVRPASGNLPVRQDDVAFSPVPRFSPPPPIAFDYRLALDEFESICRTRAGYAFTELPPELQEAVLSLIASRDLATHRIDLALWLEVLRRNPAAATL